LNLSSSAAFSGTATTAGSSTFTIQVKDAANATRAKSSFDYDRGVHGVPQFGHIAIVVEENTDYQQRVGGMAMPYLNGLISQYGLATQYYPTHIRPLEITLCCDRANSDEQMTAKTPSSFPVNADNVVRELILAGKT